MSRKREDDFSGFACQHCGLCVQDEEEQDTDCPHGPFEPVEERPCNWSETLIHEDENDEWVDADTVEDDEYDDDDE